MKTILVTLVFSLSILLMACGKDKFQTKPRIEIKEYSSKEIPKGGVLTIKLNYFDKEGDLGLGQFYAYRDRLNVIPLGINEDRADELNYPLPEFNDRDNGEITLTLNEVDFLKESLTYNDTLRFKIAVTDRAGNTSDTLITDNIVILLP